MAFQSNFPNNISGDNDALVGSVTWYAGNTIPAGWLLCDGSAVSRTDYAKLFSAIGTTWGAGDGSTTFNLPNSIGRFAEGAATSGSYKSAGLPNITGSLSGESVYASATPSNPSGLFDGADGAFSLSQQGAALQAGGGLVAAYNDIHMNASRSSSIYGNSTTVQPNSFTVRYIIKY